MAEPTLERGSEGPDVKALQEALIELEFKPGAADGVFGVYTESAVRAFQTWANIDEVDGIVGPDTWEKLDEANKDDPTVKNGSREVAVRGVQRRLIQLGFDPGEIDGDFGDKTEAAVKAFQEKYKLEADGIVGPLTWAALNSPPVDED
jgi:peptidoglycan hydrolase-like protein with peptidoglycan-binding domain